MRYSVTRKINLGRFGLQYEAIDIGVEDCATKKEAMDEIRVWKQQIINVIRDSKSKSSREDNELPF